MVSRIRFGEVLRYPASKSPEPEYLDDLRNFHHVTRFDGTAVLLDAGISGMARVQALDGPRRPGVMIRSAPWKAGSERTPWHDVFDLDNGSVRYFGDHKPGHADAVGTTTDSFGLILVGRC